MAKLHDTDSPTTEAPYDEASSEYSSNSDSGLMEDATHTAASAMETIQNHPATQTIRDTMSNGEFSSKRRPSLPLKSKRRRRRSHTDHGHQGPVAQNMKHQSEKASAEFRDLANARTTPEQPAATGQPLTHYHSMFYRLLSWKNPRASAISFAASALFIFAARYLNVLRYLLKVTYLVLGTTALAEIAGKTILGNGLASQMRPRKYYLIPRDSLNRFLDDVEQLINFFVVEFQRIVFAENVYATTAAFFAAFFSYWLIKFLPLWGLSLLSTCVIYLGPLIYIKNKEVIDGQLESAGTVLNEQTAQLRDLAAHHTGRATETMRTYAGEYSQKAQDMIGQARNKATGTGAKASDFPTAPKSEPQTAEREASPEPIAS